MFSAMGRKGGKPFYPVYVVPTLSMADTNNRIDLTSSQDLHHLLTNNYEIKIQISTVISLLLSKISQNTISIFGLMSK